jgi:hypothetical protein
VSVTSNDIANQAIQIIGDNQPPVTGVAPNFDTSAAGIALSKLYTPCVQAVARQFGWDFTRNTVALTPSGNAAPFPWTVEYNYPSNGVEIWQLTPPNLSDPNNPLPVNWAVANTVVLGVQTRVIHANLVGALAVYNNAPAESAWDSLFREEVVRLLASELAMALAGRPDTAQSLLDSAGGFGSLNEGRMG